MFKACNYISLVKHHITVLPILLHISRCFASLYYGLTFCAVSLCKQM